MSIDQLIRDLIVEDLFKGKYTARQRSIFCQNMYTKVSTFIEENTNEKIQKIEQLEEELAVAENDLEYYKESYEELNHQIQLQKSILLNVIYGIHLVIYVIYVYSMFKYYNVNEDKSIKEITVKSDTPYSIE